MQGEDESVQTRQMQRVLTVDFKTSAALKSICWPITLVVLCVTYLLPHISSNWKGCIFIKYNDWLGKVVLLSYRIGVIS